MTRRCASNQQADLTFGCDHTSHEDPCPAQTLYDRAYPESGSDLYGWTRFHHGWHARDAESQKPRIGSPDHAFKPGQFVS